MFQTTEVFQLAIALVLAPLIARSIRAVRMPGRRTIGVALLFIVMSYVFTLLEGLFAPTIFNALEHMCLAGCGISFALAARAGRSHWYVRESGEVR